MTPKSKHLVDVVLLLSLATTLQVACAPAPPARPPAEESDAARGPSCSSACERLRALGCMLGQRTPRGATCETVCTRVQTDNDGAGFPVACLAAAKTCAIADACR